MSSKAEKLEAFGRLLDIMDRLRAECPWDKKQTFESLRHLTIEETYELGDAILSGNRSEIKKELGDLLLHIVFYSKLGSEEKAFDISDVAHEICEKLIYRHPHIYGDVKVQDEAEVKKNWEALKLKEGKKTVLGGVPKGLPALVKAQRIQDKVAGVGFDWDTTDQVWEKVQEELREFQEEIAKGDSNKSEEEFGDVLFSLINYARFLKINPDTALERTNQKFIQRFNYLETKAQEMGKTIGAMSLKEMEALWMESKNHSSSPGS
ncbi:nucleoside triphosphate pyrophosphohydrolase [Flavobacteriaceae bacterium]|jgi:XTP/dITP diphosphohydrolase|nr:nucleoside triphosphate pyrophosphohydrolase [Flavobacteriaceae bacterium]MDC0872271.1 nucleoside triphosphate pyrophosphohydrolase [Flavobacteriaceae bacterium]